MIKKRKKVVIIDGNALIHRSFHALPPTITTRDGEIVNAVFGFTSGLLKAIKDLKPDYLVATFDLKGPTFRHEKFKEYKATRTKAPDELYKQIPRVKEVVKAFNIPIYEISKYEADDLIGTICSKIGNGMDKVIVTGDMDILQLIDDTTKVYRMSRGVSDYVLFGENEVVDKYNIKPSQVIDYKALRGDASDNIPGVKGVGDKTATTLLAEFRTLDGIYKNIDSEKIKPRIQNLLKDDRDNAYLSYDLATIVQDAPVEFNLDDALVNDFDKEKVVKLLTNLEFKSLLNRVRELGSDNVTSEENSVDKFERNKKKFKYTLVDSENKFKKFLIELKKQKSFAFDTETTGVNPLSDELLGISFCWKRGEAYYVLINNEKLIINNEKKENLFNYQEEEKIVKNVKHSWLEKLKPIFTDAKIKKFAHNMKFDMRFMGEALGAEVEGIEFDTMIAAYLLNSGSRQLNLDAVSFSELGFEKISKVDLIGKGRDKITFSEVTDEKMSLYSCEDSDCTFQLVKTLKKQLKDKNLQKLNREIEVPLITTLARMENNGIIVDKKFLGTMSKKLNKEIKSLEKEIFDLAGAEFNIKSTKQLKEILFEKLEIPTAGIKKTKTGFSTAFDELEKIKEVHPVISYIQEYRELTKLTSTYIDALPELINQKTGRVHTSFNQTVAATGRLSSTNPNLQNIPVRTEHGKEIRKAFIVPSGFKLLAIDYSQIELRIAAHMSMDPHMIEAFKNNKDIHATTAAKINRVKLNEVDKKMRSEAKSVNFGILYGQGSHGLSKATGLSFVEAKEFIEKYFENFSGVKKYLDSQIDHAKEHGYVETLFGRKRYLPEIESKMGLVRKAAERMAVNTPIQGTAADMMKISMNKVADLLFDLRNKGKGVKMLVQVHDELLFEVEENQVEEIAKEIKKVMENVVKLKVPVVADVKIGDNWGEMKELDFKN
jgi:DNA polymerase I